MNDNEITLSMTIDGLKELLAIDRCETCPQTANLDAEIASLKNRNHELEDKCMKAIAERDELKAKLETTANECYKCTHEGRLAAAERCIKLIEEYCTPLEDIGAVTVFDVQEILKIVKDYREKKGEDK